jgi:hypothetical protein
MLIFKKIESTHSKGLAVKHSDPLRMPALLFYQNAIAAYGWGHIGSIDIIPI